MDENVSRDVTYILFRSLVSAKLNNLVGNESSCVDNSISGADEWMATYGPIGSEVRSGGLDSPWRTGDPIYLQLDDYNNGLPCAPPRD